MRQHKYMRKKIHVFTAALVKKQLSDSFRKLIEMHVNVSKINPPGDVHGLIQNASRLNSRFALITGYMTASCFSPGIFARTGSERTQIILFPLVRGTRNRHNARFRERASASFVVRVYGGREYILRDTYVLITLPLIHVKKIHGFSSSALRPENTALRSYISAPREIFMQRMII